MANQEILDKLFSFCDELIGEETANVRPVKKKPNGKKSDSNQNLVESELIDGGSHLRHPKENRTPRRKKKLDQNDTLYKEDNSIPERNTCAIRSSDQHATEDGFKIVSEIPPDDSDISDAFCSDHENDEADSHIMNSGENCKQTEDGFKIVTEITPDDSDVSDAFESDLDESEWLEEVQDKLCKKKRDFKPSQISANSDNVQEKNNNLENIKKPLRKLIEDFGMEDKIYLNKNSEPRLKQQIKSHDTNASKQLFSSEEMNIIDYSSPRGKTKKESDSKLEPTKKPEQPAIKHKRKDDEFKKARYEVFKFGLNAFDKHEQKNAKIQLAIKLGAKPPKNKAINYKKLIEERKLKKWKETLKREEDREMGLMVKPLEKKARKRDVNINPPVGKFKAGVLTLSKKDIENITGQKAL